MLGRRPAVVRGQWRYCRLPPRPTRFVLPTGRKPSLLEAGGSASILLSDATAATVGTNGHPTHSPSRRTSPVQRFTQVRTGSPRVSRVSGRQDAPGNWSREGWWRRRDHRPRRPHLFCTMAGGDSFQHPTTCRPCDRGASRPTTRTEQSPTVTHDATRCRVDTCAVV